MLRLAVALFAIQAGFHGFTAALPLALGRVGLPDPEIGLIVGAAALVQLPAAIAAGALVDRFGGRRLVVAGGIAYLIGAGIMMVPGVDPAGDRSPFLLARLFQGLGIAATLPAALSLVPALVPPARRGFALAFVGSAHNLTLVVLPPLSLVVLAATSLAGVAAANIGFVLVGLTIVLFGPTGTALPADQVAGGAARNDVTIADGTVRDEAAITNGGAAAPHHGLASRRLGFAFRRSWIRPLAIQLLYVAHWGVVTAYLPQRAAAAGADIGLFFVADGLAILASRVPSGWLADRVPPRRLILLGLAVTVVAIGLLILPPTTPILIVAGLLTGVSGGLIMTPLLVELSHRANDADRGSAFALYSGALAGALVLGSIGAAPIVAVAGFEAAIAASIVGLASAAALTLTDPGLARAGAQRAGALA
jgi:MFS family permease